VFVQNARRHAQKRRAERHRLQAGPTLIADRNERFADAFEVGGSEDDTDASEVAKVSIGPGLTSIEEDLEERLLSLFLTPTPLLHQPTDRGSVPL
jgi:hypothetical protein